MFTVVLSRQDVKAIIWALDTGRRAIYNAMNGCIDEARNNRLSKHADTLAELGDRLEEILE
jgi:hypothetical protein